MRRPWRSWAHGDEPNDENPLSHFGTDMRWEIGYDVQRFTFYARLREMDPDAELPPEERWEPVFEAGTEPYEWPTVEDLDRELDAQCMWLPADVAAGLAEVQRRHLAGELGEPADQVERRRRAVRHAAFIDFLKYWIRPTVR